MDIQWPLAIFSLLAGCGGGIMACAGIAQVRGAYGKSLNALMVTALAFLIVGGCASVLHLQHKASIMAAAANIFSFSGISMELIFLGVNCVLAVLLLAMAKAGASEGAVKAVAAVAIVCGVLLAFVVGNGYVMESQATWNTPLLPLCYLASGLTCGASVWAAVASTSADTFEAGLPSKVVAVLAVAQLVLFLCFAVFAGTENATWYFWAGSVLVGCAGTFACALLARKQPRAWYGAAACALVGGLAFRCYMWAVGFGFFHAFALAAGRTVLGI